MIIAVALSIVLIFGMLKLVHHLIGLKMIKYFLNYEHRTHGDTLCSSKQCRPMVRRTGAYSDPVFDNRHIGYSLKYDENDTTDAEKRITQCVMEGANRMSKSWIRSYNHVTRQYKVAGEYTEVREDAKRLAVLEAEKAEQEANVERIRKELEITAADLFTREFAKAGIDITKLSR